MICKDTRDTHRHRYTQAKNTTTDTHVHTHAYTHNTHNQKLRVEKRNRTTRDGAPLSPLAGTVFQTIFNGAALVEWKLQTATVKSGFAN